MKLRWLQFVCLLSACSAAFGQRYPVLQVPGAPHGIFTMMQDSESRIWMGTIDDVFCFDGVHFYSLRPYGFPKEFPNSFAEDGDGGIWIATQGTDATGGNGKGGLYRYKGGHVEKIFHGDGLSVVAVDPGIVLASIGTEGEGHPVYGDLYRFQEKGSTWSFDRLLERRVNHMKVDASGTTLFSCPAGWCEIPHPSVVEWRPGGSLEVQEHAGDHMIERVLRDRFGCVWFRSEAAASYQCPDKPDIIPLPALGYDSSAHLDETSDGSIFLLVNLTLGRPGNFHGAMTRNGIPDGLETAMVARDGTIWLGAESGLYRFMHPFQIEYWNSDHGLDGAGAILKVGDQVFTAWGAIQTLSKDRRHWTTLPGTEVLGAVGLAPGPGETMFAAGASGVFQLKTDGTIVARSERTEGGTSMDASIDGQVWLGDAIHRSGIRRVSRQGNQLLLVPEQVPADRVPILNDDVAHDALWSCDGKDLVFRHAQSWARITQKDGLLDFPCRTVASLPNGDVWMGYDNSRLALIHDPFSGHPAVRNYSIQSDQLVANSYNQFLGVDGKGRIWRGSDTEYVADAATAEAGEWLRLNEVDGLPSITANQNTFLADPDGSVWFASNSYIIHISLPEDFVTKFPAPQVFVAGYSLGNNSPVFAEGIGAIPHGSDVTVNLGSLQFDRRNGLHVRYRVLPDQSSWNSQTGLDIHLGKLRFGAHTIEVEAQLENGPWSTVRSRTFDVLRPVWLSWPAIAGCIAGILFLAGLTYRWRKRRLHREKTLLPAIGDWRLAALSPEIWNLSGTVIDERFEIGPVLARGGFATIAVGKDLQQDCPCAIKIFRRELTDQEWIHRRFQQEVLALEKIGHPNVVRIYGHGTTASGSHFLAMELIEGETLREKLDRGQLTPQMTASYLQQTGSALEEIHRHGICHRDLKPENLMIRSHAKAGEDLVLIDFSIAIVKDPDVTMHGLSRAAGTIYYMAPEQSIGYADSSTDIYSLAKVVIEMLTGKRLSALLPDASMDLPERVRELLGGLHVGLGSAAIELISSALQFDPAQRPKNAGAFATQIAQDLQSERAGAAS